MSPQRKKTASIRQAAPAAPHRLAGLRFYAGGFVLDAESGLFYRLTPAAEYLLRQYDAGTRVGDLAELIQARYGLDHGNAMRDVELVLNQFAGAGWLPAERVEATA